MIIEPNKYIEVYGFEGYSLYRFHENIITESNNSIWGISDYYSIGGGIYIPTVSLKNKPHRDTTSYYNDIKFDCPICKDNKELLDTANKLYIHPDCKLSRTVVGSKYTKCLNQWVADAVVVPKFNVREFGLYNKAFFVNESAGIAIMITLRSNEAKDKLNSVNIGTLFKDIAPCSLDGFVDSINGNIYDIYDSELVYVGDMLYIPKHRNYVADILVNNFPTDKTVFEETVQASLGNEENKLDLENIVSIGEMIESTDDNSVSAALKALSTMDYIHYSNSIKYILNKGWGNWKWNKATNSTPVKFMTRYLYDTTRKSRMCGRYSEEIYWEDYKLIKELIKHYELKSEEELNTRLVDFDFVYISSDGVLSPRIKCHE